MERLQLNVCNIPYISLSLNKTVHDDLINKRKFEYTTDVTFFYSFVFFYIPPLFYLYYIFLYICMIYVMLWHHICDVNRIVLHVMMM